MNTKAFSLVEEGLILGISRKNEISFLKAPATVKFLSQKCQRWHFDVKKSLPTQMHLYNPYRVPHTIP